MHKLEYKNGLLYTFIKLSHDNKEILIRDVIVDTGAFHTILMTDYLNDLDTGLSPEDQLVKASGYGGSVYGALRKNINKVQIGDIAIENMKIDFGEIDPYERVNGLIGLDFLKEAGLVIDLVDMVMYQKK